MPGDSAEVVDDSAQVHVPKFGLHANPPVSFLLRLPLLVLIFGCF